MVIFQRSYVKSPEGQPWGHHEAMAWLRLVATSLAKSATCFLHRTHIWLVVTGTFGLWWFSWRLINGNSWWFSWELMVKYYNLPRHMYVFQYVSILKHLTLAIIMCVFQSRNYVIILMLLNHVYLSPIYQAIRIPEGSWASQLHLLITGSSHLIDCGWLCSNHSWPPVKTCKNWWNFLEDVPYFFPRNNENRIFFTKFSVTPKKIMLPHPVASKSNVVTFVFSG
jgi:hypothetical protein